jgi:small subunit ribosomal protein S6
LLREYEFTVIAKSDLADGAKAKFFERYEELMTRDGGEILRTEDWGVRKFAFPIKKQHRGLYRIYDFIGKSENVHEMERLMRLDDGVLRYMSLNIGEGVDPVARKAQLAKEAAAAAAAARDQDIDN